MLEKLPLELLLLVQQSLDALVDLHALIAASPSNLRTFALYRQHVLPAVLKNAICPVALPSALALLQLHALDLRGPGGGQSQLPPPPPPLPTILDNYFSGIVYPFPESEDDPGFSWLRSLYVRAMRFAKDYATRALRVLSVGDADADGDKVTAQDRDRAALALHFSPSERGRILRAFFRFELYCRVFPPRISAAMHRDMFLLKLRPFEVKELACIHHYFFTIVSGCVDRLEDQFVEEVLTTTKAHADPAASNALLSAEDRRRRPPSASSLLEGPGGSIVDSEEPRHRSTVSGCQDEESVALHQEQQQQTLPLSPNLGEDTPYEIETTDQAEGNNMSLGNLDNLELSGLDLFSSISKRHYPSNISFMVSRGIEFIHTLVNADDDTRRKMILDNSPDLRPFFPEALASIPFPPDLESNGSSLQQQAEWGNQAGNNDMDDGCGVDDNPYDPNYSWVQLARSHPGGVDDYIRSKIDQAPFRARAWVFWDKKRLVGGGCGSAALYQGLLAARHMDYQKILTLYDRSQRRSGEERLSGVLVPLGERSRILHKYASTMGLSDEDDEDVDMDVAVGVNDDSESGDE